MEPLALRPGDTCPDCQQEGVKSRLREFLINLENETLIKCESDSCMYPYNGDMSSSEDETLDIVEDIDSFINGVLDEIHNPCHINNTHDASSITPAAEDKKVLKQEGVNDPQNPPLFNFKQEHLFQYNSQASNKPKTEIQTATNTINSEVTASSISGTNIDVTACSLPTASIGKISTQDMKEQTQTHNTRLESSKPSVKKRGRPKKNVNPKPLTRFDDISNFLLKSINSSQTNKTYTEVQTATNTKNSEVTAISTPGTNILATTCSLPKGKISTQDMKEQTQTPNTRSESPKPPVKKREACKKEDETLDIVEDFDRFINDVLDEIHNPCHINNTHDASSITPAAEDKKVLKQEGDNYPQNPPLFKFKQEHLFQYNSQASNKPKTEIQTATNTINSEVTACSTSGTNIVATTCSLPKASIGKISTQDMKEQTQTPNTTSESSKPSVKKRGRPKKAVEPKLLTQFDDISSFLLKSINSGQTNEK